MWIIVGGLTFLLSFFYFLHQRRDANWQSGEGIMPLRLDPGVYWRLTTDKKGGSYRLGVDCPDHFDFLIGRERGVDRFFKSVGLTHELQVNDPKFDDAVYVGCDDLYFQRLLKRSTAARSAIQKLMGRHRNSLLGRVSLQCRNGRLWLAANIKSNVVAGELWEMIRADVDDLKCLQQALQSLPVMMIEPVARRQRLQAAILSTACAALATCAVVGWLAFYWDGNHQLYLPELLFRSVLPAVLLWCVLLAATIVLLIRTSRFHLVLIEVVLFGTWGMFGATSNAYMHINIDHDLSMPVLRCTEVVDKRIQRSRRSTSYHVVLAGWQLENGRYVSNLSWRVSSDTYYSLAIKQPVSLSEHGGRLGYPWLNDLAQGCPRSQ